MMSLDRFTAESAAEVVGKSIVTPCAIVASDSVFMTPCSSVFLSTITKMTNFSKFSPVLLKRKSRHEARTK